MTKGEIKEIGVVPETLSTEERVGSTEVDPSIVQQMQGRDVSTPFKVTRYRDPTEAELQSPLFNAIWQVIKGWDIREDAAGEDRGITGAMGNHVAAILDAISSMDIPTPDPTCEPGPVTEEYQQAAEELAKGHLSAVPTDRSWKCEDGDKDPVEDFKETVMHGIDRAERIFVAWIVPTDLTEDRRYRMAFHDMYRAGVRLTKPEFLALLQGYVNEELAGYFR